MKNYKYIRTVYQAAGVAAGFVEPKHGREEVIEGFQYLIDSGLAWKLEGTIGRAASALIKDGICTLGEVGHRDYYGNYVPSKYEVGRRQA